MVLSENTCSFIYQNFVRYIIGKKKLEASKHTKSPTFSHGLCSSQTHAASGDTVPEKLQCLVSGRVLRSWTTARTPSAVGGLWSSGASWRMCARCSDSQNHRHIHFSSCYWFYCQGFGRGKEIWETTGETAGLHQRLTKHCENIKYELLIITVGKQGESGEHNVWKLWNCGEQLGRHLTPLSLSASLRKLHNTHFCCNVYIFGQFAGLPSSWDTSQHRSVKKKIKKIKTTNLEIYPGKHITWLKEKKIK